MHPLIDSLKHLREQQLALKAGHLSKRYPSLSQFLASQHLSAIDELIFVCDFLNLYARKSEASFNRFRNECERLLLFSWCFKQKSVFELTREDIEAYVEWVVAPPSHLKSENTYSRFTLSQGVRSQNESWRPFTRKSEARPAQSSLQSMYTVLGSLFKFAMLEQKVAHNPIPLVKKHCPYLLKNTAISKPDTLSELQWEYIFRVNKEYSTQNPGLNRNVFLLTCLKGLYLRISELSERSHWMPNMGHFWQDEDGYWFLRVLGKGNKLRDVTVSDAVLGELIVYRKSLGLSPLPSPDEHTPIIHKLRGKGGMTVRQLRRLVMQSFELAQEALQKDGFTQAAEQLSLATTHWLRHTGASQDAQYRPLKHLSEDLGHAKLSTTDQIYIKSNVSERAKSGSKRRL